MRAGPVAAIRAFALLTVSLVRRLSREGLVIRSLTFPPVLVVFVLMATVGAVAVTRSDPVVGVAPDLYEAGFDKALADHGFVPRRDADPHAAVIDGRAWAGTDGHTLWLSESGRMSLVLEGLLREQVDAPWRPDSDVPLPGLVLARRFGRQVSILLGALFALYGVVFGAGMVARDRDAGILEVELAMAVPRWVHGASRLCAAAIGLSVFLGLGVLLLDAVVGVADRGALIRHGVATSVGSVAIGLGVIGRGGLNNGFTGPLATGMTLATGMFGVGAAIPTLGRWLPLASFVTDGSGWEAIGVSLVLGAAAVAWFTYRVSAR